MMGDFKCNYCDKSFENKSKYIYLDDEYCYDCYTIFKNASDRVEAANNPENMKELMCIRCNSNFKTNHTIFNPDLCLSCIYTEKKRICPN